MRLFWQVSNIVVSEAKREAAQAKASVCVSASPIVMTMLMVVSSSALHGYKSIIAGGFYTLDRTSP